MDIVGRYAGIGSRETPKKVGETMISIARLLEKNGFGLNSGGAPGADSYFEQGSTEFFRKIYLPWDGFNGKYSNNKDYIVPPDASEFTDKYHPNPKALSKKGRLFMSRNAYQVLGDSLSVDTRVDFVLCWTKDGKISGGTGQAMRIAKNYGIPVFNLNGGMDTFKFYLESFVL